MATLSSVVPTPTFPDSDHLARSAASHDQDHKRRLPSEVGVQLLWHE